MLTKVSHNEVCQQKANLFTIYLSWKRVLHRMILKRSTGKLYAICEKIVVVLLFYIIVQVVCLLHINTFHLLP